jgi:hypothetical protein
MNLKWYLPLAAILALLALPASGQLRQAPRIRELGAITQVTRDSLVSAASVVHLPGGRILVNDITAERLLIFDSSLSALGVVLDSAGSGSAAVYGDGPGTLLPYRGDSALFISPPTLSMLVLAPNGAIARAIAMPPTHGLPSLLGSVFGTPGFDAQGRLCYYSQVLPIVPGQQRDRPFVLDFPDSALIVRFDFVSRGLDTVASIRIPRARTSSFVDDQGRPFSEKTAYPIATVDGWAVTSDGKLGIVRGRDYHVDWLSASGNWAHSARVAFSWARLSDSEKAALVDSAAMAMQDAIDSLRARVEAAAAARSGASPSRRQSPGSPRPAPSANVIVAEPGGAPRALRVVIPRVEKAATTEVPDYRPAFGQGAVYADREGNLWVKTSRAINGRPVYDVIDGSGQLVDRVQLPPYRSVAGFGPGLIYLAVRDSLGIVHVERARIR